MEFSEGHMALALFVIPADDLVSLTLSHKIAASFKDSAKIFGIDDAFLSNVKTVEALERIVTRLRIQLLPESLASVFHFDVHPQHVDEFIHSSWLEHILRPAQPGDIVRASPGHHLRVISVMGHKRLTEFIEVQPSILVPVISLH